MSECQIRAVLQEYELEITRSATIAAPEIYLARQTNNAKLKQMRIELWRGQLFERWCFLFAGRLVGAISYRY